MGMAKVVKEIGDTFDLSRERVRQIQVEALRRLKDILHIKWVAINKESKCVLIYNFFLCMYPIQPNYGKMCLKFESLRPR